MKVKVGTVYTAIANAIDAGKKKDFPVLVICEYHKNGRPGNQSYYDCFDFESKQLFQLRDNQLKDKMNAEEIDTLKKYHIQNIKNLELVEKCLEQMEISEISQEEFAVWAMMTTFEKEGVTKSQKIKELVKVYSSL